MTRHTVFWQIKKYRGSDWGENDTENLLLRKATVVLATIICERDDSAGEANTDTVPRFCFKERDHGSGVEIIDHRTLRSSRFCWEDTVWRCQLRWGYTVWHCHLYWGVYNLKQMLGEYNGENLLGIEESNARTSSAGIRYQIPTVEEKHPRSFDGDLKEMPRVYLF